MALIGAKLGVEMWIRSRAPLLSLAVAALTSTAACSDSTRDVSVTGRYVRLTVNGMTSDPYNMYGDVVSAHVLDASGTSFSTVPGYGGYGYLYIPRVPEGEYYLRRESPDGFALFLVTDQTEIDLSQIVIGRGDYLLPTSTTTVELTVGGMEAWQDGDELQAISNNLGLVLPGFERLAQTGTPTVGAQALDHLRVDFAEHVLPLIEEGFGDRLSVLHLTARTSPEGVPYRAVSRVYNAAPFTMTDGAPTTLSGDFTPVAQARSVAVEWRSSAFEAHRAEVSPDARTYGASFSVGVLPRAADFGDYDVGPDLVVQSMDVPADVSATLEYGDPFPEGFDELATAYYFVGVDYRAPGALRSAFVLSAMRVESTVAALAARPVLEPKLSPARAPKLQGADAFVAQTGVGLTPKLSWEAPALGQPTGYGVRISRLALDATTQTVVEPVSLILTRATEVVIPPAVLIPGETYFARIVAFDEPSRDLRAVPFRYQLPNAGAETLTATFTP